MKKKAQYSLQIYIIILFLVIIIPISVLSFYASRSNYDAARRQIMNTKKENIDFYVKQYDLSLEAVKKSIYTLLYDDKSGYFALQLSDTDSDYQMAKYSLKLLLEDYTEVFNNFYCFYVYIPGTEDTFIVRKSSGQIKDLLVTTLLSQDIKSQDGYSKIDFWEYDDTSYLVEGFRNSYMEIGYVISVDLVKEQYLGDENKDDMIQVCLIQGDSIENDWTIEEYENKKYYVYEKEYKEINATLRLLTLYENLDKSVGAQDKIIWFASLVFLVGLPIFIFIFQILFIVPMRRLSSAMKKIMSGDTKYRIDKFSNAKEFCEIEQTFNDTLDYNERLKVESYEMAIEKEKEQLLSLQLQINPHMLLNSLNTVYSLAQNKKHEEIQTFSLNLSKYFRYSLRNITEFVSIKSEMDFIKSYTKVQKIRFPNRFYVMFDVGEELLEERIPPLIIQNFVENSTKYGLKINEEIEISVVIRKHDNRLRISVCDNGMGIAPEILEKIRQGEPIVDGRGKHIGIWNCTRRLKSFYGNDVTFTITSELGKGTQVWIEVPCERIS